MKIIKFLHAADFRLHAPVTCFPSVRADSIDDLFPAREHSAWSSTFYTHVPDDIMEEFNLAQWRSAKRVFDIAIQERVDFVFLTGDVLDPKYTGARGIVFLAEQFRRLEAEGIPVYWRTEHSFEGWVLPDFKFSKNVFQIPNSGTYIRIFKPQNSKKNLFIVSWSEGEPDFSRFDFSKLPQQKLPHFQTICIQPDTPRQPGEMVVRENDGFSCCYRTISGRTQRNTSKREVSARGGDSQKKEVRADVVTHTPGAIQRVSPDEMSVGGEKPGGVSIVKLDLEGEEPISIDFHPTETVAWRRVFAQIPSEVSEMRQLVEWLKERQRLESEKDSVALGLCDSSRLLLLFWVLKSDNRAMQDILREIFLENLEPDIYQEERVSEIILNALRKENLSAISAKNSDGPEQNPNVRVWSTSIATPSDLIPPEWAQGDSMLGNYLRLALFHQNNPTLETNGAELASGAEFAPHDLDLSTYLTPEQKESIFAKIAKGMNEGDEVQRKEILQNAAIIGASALKTMRKGRDK
ncbi:MAG: hypothetical protein Q4D38_13740 [Planctomycetia bacterium]|nr:hypothetical protein [Planctomycetia bacterium]